mgnify:CR=1 FL=1
MLGEERLVGAVVGEVVADEEADRCPPGAVHEARNRALGRGSDVDGGRYPLDGERGSAAAGLGQAEAVVVVGRERLVDAEAELAQRLAHEAGDGAVERRGPGDLGVEGRGPLRERRERRLEFGGVAELERRSGDDGLVGHDDLGDVGHDRCGLGDGDLDGHGSLDGRRDVEAGGRRVVGGRC